MFFFGVSGELISIVDVSNVQHWLTFWSFHLIYICVVICLLGPESCVAFRVDI